MISIKYFYGYFPENIHFYVKRINQNHVPEPVSLMKNIKCIYQHLKDIKP